MKNTRHVVEEIKGKYRETNKQAKKCSNLVFFLHPSEYSTYSISLSHSKNLRMWKVVRIRKVSLKRVTGPNVRIVAPVRLLETI